MVAYRTSTAWHIASAGPKRLSPDYSFRCRQRTLFSSYFPPRGLGEGRARLAIEKQRYDIWDAEF